MNILYNRLVDEAFNFFLRERIRPRSAQIRGERRIYMNDRDEKKLIYLDHAATTPVKPEVDWAIFRRLTSSARGLLRT